MGKLACWELLRRHREDTVSRDTHGRSTRDGPALEIVTRSCRSLVNGYRSTVASTAKHMRLED